MFSTLFNNHTFIYRDFPTFAKMFSKTSFAYVLYAGENGLAYYMGTI